MTATSLRFSNSAHAATDAGEPLTSSPMTRVLVRRRPVGHPHDAHVGAIGGQSVRQRRGERGKPARCRWIRTENAETRSGRKIFDPQRETSIEKLDKAVKVIPTGGCHLRVRRERLLGAVSGRRLTHPGLAGFPTALTIHPGATPEIPPGESCCASRLMGRQTNCGLAGKPTSPHDVELARRQSLRLPAGPWPPARW